MKKVYQYDPKEYAVGITYTGVFTALIFAGAVITAVIMPQYWLLGAFVALVSGYSTWNTFVAHANPSEFIVEEDGVSFVSFGRADKYRFDELKTFLAKDFRGSGKIFIRVNNYNWFKGRYWLHTARFNDKDELFMYILKLEYHTHPAALKARAWDSTQPDFDKTPYLPWEDPLLEERQ